MRCRPPIGKLKQVASAAPLCRCLFLARVLAAFLHWGEVFQLSVAVSDRGSFRLDALAGAIVMPLMKEFNQLIKEG